MHSEVIIAHSFSLDMTDFTPEELLPHRGNMLLVKKLESLDMENLVGTALAYLDEDCIFYDRARGGIIPEISIEIMAQGIGLLTCARERMEGLPPMECAKLISIKGYEVFCDTLPAGVWMRSIGKITMEASPVCACECELYRTDTNELLAKAEVTAYKP